MERRKRTPYWIEGGTECCEVCMTVHVLQMHYRCVACDHGLCEQCSVFVSETREVFCADCHASEVEEA